MDQLLDGEIKILLDRTALSEQVTSHVTQLIISGEITPYVPITEKLLVNAFDISRPTAKDSLRMLVMRSLVTQRKNQSAYVTVFTPKDYQDLLTVRKVTEIAVIEALFSNLDEGVDHEKLESMTSTIDLSVERDVNTDEVIAKEIDFHSSLVELSDSPHIARAQNSHIFAFHLSLRQLSKRPDPHILAEHHHEILEGLRVNDDEMTMNALKAHVDYFKSI